MEKLEVKDISPRWKKPYRSIWFPEPLKDFIKKSPTFETIKLKQRTVPSKKGKTCFFSEIFNDTYAENTAKGKKKKRRMVIGKYKTVKRTTTE